MRKLLFIVGILMVMASCENEQQPEEKLISAPTAEDSIQIYQGTFITVGKSAVLKGNQFVYEVKMDSMAKLLKDSFKNYELIDSNLIPIEVKGKVTNNVRFSGYSQIIEIKEIVAVFAEKQSENEKTEN
ncbi:hypothetical protein ACKGJN_02105 [Gillisia sp. Q332]|uniref:hypothetical protein n=1 Tax=Gillisia xinjiangensis TaxID=3384765 RepID=UPI0039188585